MITLLVLMLLGDAMVREDATFYLVPGDARTAVRFFALDNDAIPVTIVAQTGDMLEVELVQTDTCAARRLVPDERVSGLRFHVNRADLAQVVTKPFAITYANGTSARVAPGTPVVRTDDGYAIFPRGDRIVLPIPETSVGDTYKRSKVRAPVATATSWELDGPQKITLGDAQIEVRGRWTFPKPAKGKNLKWSMRCVDLVVAAPADHLVKYSGPELTPLFMRAEQRLVHVISHGTPLSTPSGDTVGTAKEPIPTRLPAGGMACFDAIFKQQLVDRVGRSYVRSVELCGRLATSEP